MRTFWLSGLIRGLVHLHHCKADGTYRTRPDLAPPRLNVTIPASTQVEQGYIFVSPYSSGEAGTPQSGPYILDNSGGLVWSGYGYFSPTVANFQPARWKGQEVLFGYEGTLNRFRGHGHGHHKIVDKHYQTIREVRSASHYLSDLHEFAIVNEETALVGSYTPRQLDLRPYGGDENQTWIIEYILQGRSLQYTCRNIYIRVNLLIELDIETGEVLFEWHSLDHTSPKGTALSISFVIVFTC
jgi:hypothetical protein